MTAGKKHLKLIKRFYDVSVEKGTNPSSIIFYNATTDGLYDINKGRYICFIEEEAYIISLEHEQWEEAVEKLGAAYVQRKNKMIFVEGLMFINNIYNTESYITKLNKLQMYDYYGLLRNRYIELEDNTTGLYLIKN